MYRLYFVPTLYVPYVNLWELNQSHALYISQLAIFNKYCGQNSTICLPGAYSPLLVHFSHSILNLNLFVDSVHCHLAPLFFFFFLLFLVFIMGGGGLHHLHLKKSYNSCLYDNFSCLSTFIAFVNFCAHDLNLYNAYFYHVTYLKKKKEEKILEMFIYKRKF